MSERLFFQKKNRRERYKVRDDVARPEGFEPPAFRIGICCDIQLRYGRIKRFSPFGANLLYPVLQVFSSFSHNFFLLNGGGPIFP